MTAIDVTEQTFEAEVLQSDMPVLVDFWGDDCVKCKVVAGVMDQLADEFAGRVKIVKMWLTPETSAARRYQLVGIPTLILFKEGEPIARAQDTLNRHDILEKFGPMLGV